MSINELLIIMLVAMLVLGPQRIPKIAYTFSRYLQKIRQFAEQFKNEVESQLKQEHLLDNKSRAQEADELYKQNK